MTPKLLLLLAAATTAAASAAADLTPPIGYRQWFHVNSLTVDSASPLFATLGGLHNIYVNAKGLPGLQKGGAYADGSVFVDDIHAFTLASGVYSEGSRKALSVMVKDSKTYMATGGWGFQLWAAGDAAKPVVTDAATQCFACHTPQKDHDYVFSTYIP